MAAFVIWSRIATGACGGAPRMKTQFSRSAIRPLLQVLRLRQHDVPQPRLWRNEV
jgi:hypothetical protein